MAVAAKEADIAIMAAAPADFTPASSSQTKIKKSADGGSRAEAACRPPTYLPSLVAARTDPRQILVGFAAETPGAGETLLDLGRAKLTRKGCDLLVLNEVGHNLVFGQDDSQITLLTKRVRLGPSAAARTHSRIKFGTRHCRSGHAGRFPGHGTQTVHLGVGDGGASGQDC